MNKRHCKPLPLLAACLLLGLSAGSNAEDVPAQIRVVGQGEVRVEPDMALMQLTVTREAATARAALDANSEAMAAVLAAMREGGVADSDLQTGNFSIQPRYVYPKPRSEQAPRILGYTVSNSLAVRVRELDKLGGLLDQSVTLGVNEGGHVQFGNDDPSAVLARARTLAVKDALDKARTIAEAAGVALGEIRAIDEQFHQPRPMMMRGMAMEAAAAADAVPVATGQNSYRVQLSVSVAIDQ